jgi:hypothetical protein
LIFILGAMFNFLKQLFRPKSYSVIVDQFETPTTESIYVNHFIMRAIENKETIEINRSSMISMPEYDIDAKSIRFDKIVARCKDLMSHCNPLHVVWHKEPKQEAYIKFVIDEDHVYISVVTKQAE